MSEVINIANFVANREAREDAVVAFFRDHPELLEVTEEALGSRKFKKAQLAAALHELLEAVKKGRTPKAAPKAAPASKPKRTLEDVVKTAFPGINSGLLAKIVSRSTMSRNGLVVTFQEESHCDWFQKRHQCNPNLAYAKKGVTITVTKKK